MNLNTDLLFQFYNYGVGDMTVVCFDEEGSCSRNQCECDAKFYKDVWHLALSGLSYDFQYSSSKGFTHIAIQNRKKIFFIVLYLFALKFSMHF